MKKLFGMLLALVMVLCMITTSFAAEKATSQVVNPGGVKYFKADGTETNNETFPGGDAVVKLSKKIAGTEKENEFIVTLEVSTTQEIEELQSDTPDAAVMLIIDVSNSMDDCDVCGQESSSHGFWTGHQYVSRLAKAKDAAIQFLDDFASKTGVQSGDKRYVAIVDFGSTAHRRLNWVDVTNASQMESAKAQIQNLTVAHSDLEDVWDNGGTNIEGALMLAANVWENNATAADVSYKYTILLTDGNPTFHVTEDNRNSTLTITGTAGGSNVTKYEDAKDVGTQANRILGLNGVSKLYSICFGDDVWDKKPFSDTKEWTNSRRSSANPKIENSSMTVGQWLKAFSTNAFNGEATDLFDTFNSVISQIQLAAQAWKVTDIMGTHVVYGDEVKQGTLRNRNSFDEETGMLTWNILQSDHSAFENKKVGNTEYSVLTYTYKYKIILDNLDKSYIPSNDGTAANNVAKLTFAVKDTDGLWKVRPDVVFPVPKVKGFTGELSFDKVWMNDGTEEKLSGAVFTLTSKEKSAEGAVWSQQATSDANGKVKFIGIPSGHTYTLTETHPTEGFAAADSRDVVVSYGNTTCANLTGGKIVNEKTNKTVNLTLKKAFGSSDHPASILFTVTGPNYREPVLLNADNNWTVTLYGLTPGQYTISEDAEWPGYDLTSSVVINDGASQAMTHNNVVVNLGNNIMNSVTSHTVTFNNTYKQQVGKVAMEKTFWEREHDDLINDAEQPDMIPLDKALYENIVVTITLQKGDQTHDVVLNESNNWSGSLENLPVGEYTILENAGNKESIAIPEHEFIHLHVTVDGQELKSNKITIGKDSNIVLNLENHYSHHMGDITVVKTLSGIEEDAIPAGTTFLVDVYPAKNGEKDGTTPVTTIIVAKLEGGVWRGTSKDIPVGKYWLEERTPAAIPGYDFEGGAFDSQLVLVNNETTTTLANLTNTYQQQKGTLTVNKLFGSDEASQEAKKWLEDNNKEIHVLVMDAVHGHDEVTRLKLTGPAWTDSIELPLGTYHLSEVVAVGAEGTADVGDYGVVEHWDNNVVEITADNYSTVTFTRNVTNTYTRDRGSVHIQKVNAGVSANLVPESMVAFHFFKETNGSYAQTPDTIVTLPDTTQEQGQKWQKKVDLPTGTYLVKEFGAADLFENYTFDGMDWNKAAEVGNVAPASEGYELTVQENDTIELVANNHYTRDTGSLTIKKAFSGLTAEQYKDLEIEVEVFKAGNLFETVTLKKDNNWTHTLTGLDVDVTYSLSEKLKSAQVEGYNLSHSWENARVILEKNQTVTSTVTNTYTQKTGKLSLHKRFDGVTNDEMALLDGATVTVTITGNSEVKTVTLNNAGGWESEEIELPIGTYTLREDPVAINGYTHSDVGFAGAGVVDGGAGNNTASVTVADNAKVEVHLTNTMTRNTGKLKITKAFANDSDLKADNFANKSIDVLVKRNGVAYTTVTLNQGNSWSVTLENVPTDTYTVEEVTENTAVNSAAVKDYALEVTYSDNGTVTVTKDATAALTVTNKYTRHVGYIMVKKVFEKDTDSLAAEKFIPETGIAIRVLNSAGQHVTTLHVSRTKVITDPIALPVGIYTLQEVKEAGAEGTAYVDGYTLQSSWSENNGTVTVTEGPVANAQTFTLNNKYTRNQGILTVEKAYDGLEDALKPEITVYVKQGAAVVKELKLNAANPRVEVKLPTGNYTVEEAEGTAAVTGYSLNVNYDKQNVSLTSAGAAVKITNTYEQQKGTLTVNKLFDSGEASQEAKKWLEDNNKEIHVLVMDYVHGHHEVARLKLTRPDWTDSIKLPLGTYHLSEVVAVGAEGTADVGDYGLLEHWDSNVVEITADNYSTVTFTRNVTNTYTRDRGSVHIQKVNAGVPANLVPESMVAFHFFKETNGSYAQTPDAIVTLPDTTQAQGQKWQKKVDLPTGTYLVKEFGAAELFENYTFKGLAWNNGTVASASEGYKLTVQENGTIDLVANNHYTRDTGTLTIKKEFTGLTADQYEDLEIKVEVFKAGELFKTVTLNKGNNWTYTLTGLDVGVTYTLSEKLESAQVEGYNLSHSWENASVILEKDQSVTSTVTNTYAQHVGNLTITKEFSGLPENVRPEMIQFTVQKVGDEPHHVTLPVEHNGNKVWSVKLENLPVGEYTVTEIAESAQVPGYTVTVPVDQTVNVTEGANVEAKVTNTYTRDIGQLTVEKTYVGLEDALKPDITVYVKQGETVVETLTLIAPNWKDEVKLPTGDYTVVEDEGRAAVTGYGLNVSYDKQDVNLTSAGAAVKITNTYAQHVGNLTITKEFIGLPENMRPEKIQFTVQKVGDEPHHVTLPVEHNGNKVWSVTLENLPVGEYTVTEIAETAQVPGYTVTVPAGQTVNVTEGADVEAKVINQYEFIPVTGNLTITKAFAAGSALSGERFDSIKVNVMQNGAVVQTVTLLKSEGWTKTIEIPFGTYTVVEDTASAAAPGYSLSVTYDKTEVTVSAAAGDAVTITNRYTYIPVTGSLNLTKAFQGPQYLYPTSVEFTVTGPAYSQKVTLSAENNWMVTLSGLVPGEYTVTETLTDGYSYDVQSIWSNADGKVQVQAGQMSTLKCTNVYTERPTVSVRIPVEKTVMLAGSIAPDQVFYFSFQAAWQGGPVVMRFENDPSNTAGIFQQTSANTYGVTVKGDGTVKGYIVLEGYMEDLLNGKLQTWEMLSGYATAEEALAAGWTFDKTATDGTVVWNVQLGHDGQGGIQARIARTDGQPTDQVSFLNVHTVPFDPPQTGDEENLLLWLALCGISAMCVLCLVRSKKNTSYQVK